MRIPATTQNALESSSKTTIENVNVISRFGTFDVLVDNKVLDIGTVIKAKGTISEFRGIKQLEMKRAWVVATTNEEAQAWEETAVFKQQVLSVPWRLTSADHKKVKLRIKAEKKQLQEYERRKAEHEARKKEQREAREVYTAQREARLEMRRRKEEVMMNAGALG